MNRFLSFAALLAVTFPTFAYDGASAEDAPNAYPGYKLVFQDEFDKGTVPDPEVWTFETGFCRNHEDQYYQQVSDNPDMLPNCRIEDGMLLIECRKEKVPNKDYQAGSDRWNRKNQFSTYTSGSMQTRRDKGYQWYQGIFEAKVFLPIFSGAWPAFWSTGNQAEWPFGGEIDFMEYYRDRILGNVAWGADGRNKARWNSKSPMISEFGENFPNEWHIFKMVWDDDFIRLYMDDILINEVNLDETVNHNMNEGWYDRTDYNPFRDPANTQICWLNFALGGDNGGAIDDSKLPALYKVDWVRVYQPDGTPQP